MKKLLTENIGIKVLSLLLAVVVWAIIINVNDPLQTKTLYNVEVKLLNTGNIEDQDRVYEVLEGSSVDIRASVRRNMYNSLTANDFTVTADFAELYNNLVPIKISCAKTGVEIISQSYNFVKVLLDDVVTRQFFIKIDQEGTAPEGFVISEIQPTPSVIQITGAKTKLDQIDSVHCRLNVSSIDESESMMGVVLRPELQAADGSYLSKDGLYLSSDRISISATVQQTKIIPIQVQTTGTPADGYEIVDVSYDPVEVEVAGSEEKIDAISGLTVEVPVDGAKDIVEKILNLSDYVPEGIRLVNADKASLNVRIVPEKKIARDFTMTIDQLTFENLGPDLEYKTESGTTVVLTLYGLKENLGKINTSDLHPRVNLEGLGEGTHTLEVQIDEVKTVAVEKLPEITLTIVSVAETESESTEEGN
ncbi:MAG: hypothetical protein IJU99_08675 [Lachnospiraceae bacterium]|nr:hypothetical protein [Lachnospiraceae bacterium]